MEEKFKEINEANEVLKDEEKRRRYDMLGNNWRQGQNVDPNDFSNIFNRARRSGPGAGFGSHDGAFGFDPGSQGGAFSDFFEAFFGGRGGGMGGANPFERFQGSGSMGGFQPEDPFASETRSRGQASSRDVQTRLTISLADAYRGAQRRITFQRNEGTGGLSSQSYDVKIPAGIRNDQKIRLKGQGSTIGGVAGDILITIQISPDPRFKLEGDDLIADLPLTPWEAALGASISVPTLEDPVVVKVPSGIKNGQRLRVRGHGWPRKGHDKGNLFLRVVIQVPDHLSDQERDLFEKLARVSRFNPRH
jgi:curved DNA-binding protein